MGNNIRDLRISKGLTLVELGDMCGMSKSSLSSIEMGKSTPSIQRAYAISKSLGVRIDAAFPDLNKYTKKTVKTTITTIAEG